MRTHEARAWQAHFTQLRTPVLSVFPRLDRQDVEAAGDDFDALVHVIQRRTGLSATDVLKQLRELFAQQDVDGTDASSTDERNGRSASVDQLRIEFGFEESEHPRILDMLRKLDRQLRRFPANAVDMELTVKDRDTTAQKVTLEAWLPNLPTIVATSKQISLRDALMDVREEAWRQIKEQLDRRRG
jgi:hypothetical protein